VVGTYDCTSNPGLGWIYQVRRRAGELPEEVSVDMPADLAPIVAVLALAAPGARHIVANVRHWIGQPGREAGRDPRSHTGRGAEAVRLVSVMIALGGATSGLALPLARTLVGAATVGVLVAFPVWWAIGLAVEPVSAWLDVVPAAAAQLALLAGPVCGGILWYASRRVESSLPRRDRR
jgi:hypothetical protein